MTYPRIKPCPKCGSEELAVYTYENGWRHVECDGCYYLGPGEGNILQAIQAHNTKAKRRIDAPFPASSAAKATP